MAKSNFTKFPPCYPDDMWASLGYHDWPGREQPDLKDTNNPIFHRSRYRGCGFDFMLIAPALRLASQLLYSPRSKIFIYSLVYNCQPLSEEFNHQGEPCSVFTRTLERDEKLIETRLEKIFRETGKYW